MSIEITLIIIKPDGIAKSLVGQIFNSLQANHLCVKELARIKLERDWVESLYENEKNEIYFSEVVEWVSSAPVILLKVEGIQAIDLVKWQIIGRYPHGIRGLFAENWIKNVAHAPDSAESAVREIALADPIFKSVRQKNDSQFKGKMVFALTGMSESGKSTVGSYLDSKGIVRLKIVSIFTKVRDKWSPDKELYTFLKQEEERDPFLLWDAFIDELLFEMDMIGAKHISIESLYGGGLGPYVKQNLNHHFCIIFLDVPSEIRLVRQMQRENLRDIESAKNYLLPRDEVKEKSGVLTLKKISDEVVDNSGTIEELYKGIDQLVQKYI